MSNHVPDFIRLKPLNPEKNTKTVVRADQITAYKIHPWESEREVTEIITNSGHSFLSNEPVADFEKRLVEALNPYFVN